jgi:hypothetical protein
MAFEKKVAPYGTWDSPISMDLISGSSNSFSEVHVHVSLLIGHSSINKAKWGWITYEKSQFSPEFRSRIPYLITLITSDNLESGTETTKTILPASSIPLVSSGLISEHLEANL